MSDTQEITQVSLVGEDGAPLVEGLTNFKTVGDLVSSFKEAQAKITELSQKPPTPEPDPKPKPASQAGDDSADRLKQLEINQRILRLEGRVGSAAFKELNSFLTGGSIDPQLRAAYDAAVESGNEALIDANFNALVMAYEDKHGTLTDPTDFSIGSVLRVPIPEGTQPFKSHNEQIAAQTDVKYGTDPAYRQQVDQRIAISGPYHD
jgi:hypothetical protein